MDAPFRVVVGVSGASGMPYALDLLEALKDLAEVHLVLSQGAKRVLWEEMGLSPKDLHALAHRVYKDQDLGAPIASGSFPTRGMVVVPCSATTLAKVATGLADKVPAPEGDDLGHELLALVTQARAAGLDPEDALRRTAMAWRDALGAAESAG
mgnify:CR=1 FL=1